MQALSTFLPPVSVKSSHAVRTYYVLPCCLLLLNLGVEIVTYKAKGIADPWLRTGFIMGMVLFGASLVTLALAPAVAALVRWMHQGSRQQGGRMGEALFLAVLGAAVFWLYYQTYIVGPESLLPATWENGG